VEPKVEAPKAEPVKAAVPAVEQTGDAVIDAIVKFQTGLFAQMGVEATPVVTKEGDTYQVVLQGENMGALIGHRGETLDAIQQLTGYAVNRGRSHRARIHVDAEGYRARREESLERLARKTAARVVKYRRNVTLEAMNAYERHVIHSALQDFAGVTTYSTGTEPNRRTVVAYDPSKK
jgi:spoIIIJ-associated protein